MIELNEDNLDQVLAQHDKVMVLYGAGWCGVCRLIKPKFSQLAKDNNEIAFVYVDAEKYPNARQHANVSNLPTFAGFHKKELLSQGMGSKEETLKEIINEVASH